MAGQDGKFVMEDATVVVDGTDLSRMASSCSMDLPDDEVDQTAFKGGGSKEINKGLSDSTINVNFFNAYGADQTDAVLWPLKQSKLTFKMYVQAFDGVPAENNPAYGLNARLFNYAPINGTVGESSTTEVAFRNGSSETGIVKMVSPGELAAFLAAS